MSSQSGLLSPLHTIHKYKLALARANELPGSKYPPEKSAAMLSEARTLRDDNNFIENVSQFYNQADLSDIVLKVGDQQFFAHKFVLAKSSTVFKTMLYDHRWTQAGKPEVELNESPECLAVFGKFLRFLYTAEISISVDSAVGILCLADKYNVQSLKALCTQYMVENARSPRLQNALNWYSWAKALNMDELIRQCSKTIAWNVEGLIKSPDWLNMDIDFVVDILKSSDLVVTNEYNLYLAMLKWLQHYQQVTSSGENAFKLLPLIRYPQMMVHHLYLIERSEHATDKVIGDLLLELVGKAYRFRSLCPAQNDLDVDFNEPFYLPRNYLDLVVDTVRMQNTLRFGIQVDVRTQVGAIPLNSKEGEWKITYRKTNDSWTIQMYCHDSATVNGEATIQASLIIFTEEDGVLQVEDSPRTVCTRGNSLGMSVNLPGAEDAKIMSVLIKPLPK